MPRKRSFRPEYTFHLSGQARVYLDGRYFYLGEHDSPQSWAKYYALVNVYIENGQRMPEDCQTHLSKQPITVRCVTAEFRDHIESKYANNKTQRGKFNNLCETVDDEYADTPAEEFGPRKLAAIRDLLVATTNRTGRKNTRRYVNEQVRSVVKIFRHAVSRELIDVKVVIALETLEPLAYGQTDARESDPVRPVDIEAVRLTAQHLSPVIKAMVRVQAATGMRPGEVCKIRPCDIEHRDDGVWVYRPPKHKTTHHGKVKAVPLVGDAKLALKPFLDRDPEDYCFKPADAAEWHLQQRRLARTTPLNQGDRPGYGKTTRTKTRQPRQYRDCYNKDSYRKAIERAAVKAGTDHWFPYQLRHTAGTAIREALGIEAAQAMLGHSRAAMTEHYAKQSLEKAIAAAEAGPTL